MQPEYKVLLIEEDAVVSEQIKDWLCEYAVITHAKNISDATLLSQEVKWDLVITDTKHSLINDLDITKMVKSKYSASSVLIVTEKQGIDFILSALENHADGLLFKPLDKKKFLELALRLAATTRANMQKSQDIILAIGAHPDDVEIGCGGSLALHEENGDIINILTLSLGEVGGDPNLRKAESKTAADILNAHLFLKKLPDTKIQEGKETIQIIEEIIQQIKPTHIYTHSSHDAHQDHRNVHRASIVAGRLVSNIYCFQSPSSSIYFQPQLFIEISKSIERKLAALAAYASQAELRPYLQNKLIYATAQYWGRFCHYGLAEPMEIVRQSNKPSAGYIPENPVQ